ncbi:glycine oxidase ThiO [Peribacillus butanolivorans]|uniref:glycine oxidase n=1 Tax=Peribacillus butanolivorans TaxID=421767 RepID=A0AAX0S7J1_9BACI|nr:glycine oxidase ThiO [Peribacillus butanolivorans]AXN41155.1 glycine oxidase ThiO [Peribacillus butanolivorans]PEJ37635.1 glycine oxidase ThiO [Peribacillus butanolivorans]
MNSIYDAIIVGGGVIGGSIAYQLAKRGKKVLLLEKDRLASKASSAAAGMLGAQSELESDNPLFTLARQSRGMFPALSEELKDISGIDIELVNKGMFKVALTSEQESDLKNMIKIQQKAGLEAEWFTTAEIRKKEPLLSDEIRGAMYIPKDGQVSASRLSLAFTKSAAARGADIKEYVHVSDLIIENACVRGVVTNIGEFFSENVIVASGAWSNFLLEKAGVKLDTYPVKGECFSVLTNRPLLEKTIFSHGCYLVPKVGGRIIVGATVKAHTFEQKVSIEGISTLIEKATHLLPALKETEWEKAWAGIRPQTGDGLPYFGEHPAYNGLFIATGHFRNGILLSPITGVLIADIVERKANSEWSAFRVDRSINTIFS